MKLDGDTATKTVNLLVIDDEEQCLMSVMMMFYETDVNVIAESDSRRALEYINKNRNIDNIIRSKEFMRMVNTHGKEVKFIEEEPMYVDLLVLSNCKSLIIAPSTLSAWSAYMNDHKNIYVPRIWTKHHWTNDVPLEWKLL